MPSSVIRTIRYDPVEEHLDVIFVSGRRYRYHHVPEHTYDEMRQAPSKGAYFNDRVRDRYTHTRVV